MLQLSLVRDKTSFVSGFHPNSPVKPRHSIKIEQIPVFRPQYFPQNEPKPWLDRENAKEAIALLLADNRIDEADAQLCHNWIEDGCVVVRGLFDARTLDNAWKDYERAIANSRVVPQASCKVNGLPGRNLNTHFQVKKIAGLLKDTRITRIVSMLIGAKCLPFQTITGHNGSQQLEHSDAIHMTTYPMDYLVAAWVAMENIDSQAGPLVYYPGSHRLPHFFSAEADISVNEFAQNGYAAYRQKYEPQIQQMIRAHNLKPKYFLPQKGDVLLWHSNLIHGGSPRQNLNLSRRALVCHYFAHGCICYHDLAASLAHIHTDSRLVRLSQKIANKFKLKK